MDDAGPALRRVASDMGAGQAQILAQELHEQRPRIDIRRCWAAVDRHRDMNHSDILPNQDFFGATSAVAGATLSVAAAAKLVKNLSAIFLATPSIRREPSWAILPPTVASTSYRSSVPPGASASDTFAPPLAKPAMPPSPSPLMV